MTIYRYRGTPEARAFWEACERSAALVRNMPSWTKAGINICPSTYETQSMTTERCAAGGCARCAEWIARGGK